MDIMEDNFPISNSSELNINTFEEILDFLGIDLKFDLIKKEAYIKGLPSEYSKSESLDILSIYLKEILRKHDIKLANKTYLDELIKLELAKKNFNPVLNLLKNTNWDKKDRLSEIYNILGLTDAFDKTLVKKWLYQTVAILFNTEEFPFGIEGILTLQGGQGVGKSRFFELLSINPIWFKDGVSIDMNNKDSLLIALGHWYVELGEVDSTLKRVQSSLKAFITSTFDTIRPPYGKTPIKRPRNTSLCATVNPSVFLKDDTGNRRFWIIPIKKIDNEKLKSFGKLWIVQLWAQVYHDVIEYYKENKNYNIFRLTGEEQKILNERNKNFLDFLPYEEELLQRMTSSVKESWTNEQLRNCFFNNATSKEIGSALRKIQQDHPDLVDIKRTSRGIIYYLPIKKLPR